MQKKLIKMQGDEEKFLIIARDFNIPVSIIDRTSRKKISKDTKDLSSTVQQLYLIGICQPLCPAADLWLKIKATEKY